MGGRKREHIWRFPLGPDEFVEIRLCAPTIGADVFRRLKEYLNTMESVFSQCGGDTHEQVAIGEGLEAVAVGDVVQLKPSADPAFGGLLLRVTQVREAHYRGYLLIPRRGGCRDAWYQVKPCEVGRIGRLLYPEAKWGFRPSPV